MLKRWNPKKSQLYNLITLHLSFFICKMGALMTILTNLIELSCGSNNARKPGFETIRSPPKEMYIYLCNINHFVCEKTDSKGEIEHRSDVQ